MDSAPGPELCTGPENALGKTKSFQGSRQRGMGGVRGCSFAWSLFLSLQRVYMYVPFSLTACEVRPGIRGNCGRGRGRTGRAEPARPTLNQLIPGRHARRPKRGRVCRWLCRNTIFVFVFNSINSGRRARQPGVAGMRPWRCQNTTFAFVFDSINSGPPRGAA